LKGQEELSLDFDLDREDYEFLHAHLDSLKKKYGLEGKRLRISVEGADVIPLSIFRSGIGILESLVLYLKEHARKSNQEIAALLHRRENNISVTYLKARKKQKKLDIDPSISIPDHIFSARMTCFESLVLFLHDEKRFSLTRIGELLDRDTQSIWATYKRAGEKR